MQCHFDCTKRFGSKFDVIGCFKLGLTCDRIFCICGFVGASSLGGVGIK